jgi:hypothetical protein
MKKHLKLLFGALLALCLSSPAYALVVLDDWTMDLTSIDGVGVRIEGIDKLTFSGIAVASGVDANSDGLLANGELGTVFGLLNTDNFYSSAGGVISAPNLNTTWQMSTVFDVDVVFTNDLLDTIRTFTHTGPNLATGLLDWYIDGPTDGFTGINNNNIGDWTDGVKIATWEIIPGGGGSFNLNTLDGSDDATFKLISVMSGVLFTSDGDDFADLLAGGVILPFAFTDSNFDADPDSNGNIDTNYPALPYPFDPANPFTLFHVEEDGSARVAVVPEPSTMILLGFGFLGLAVCGRRKFSK